LRVSSVAAAAAATATAAAASIGAARGDEMATPQRKNSAEHLLADAAVEELRAAPRLQLDHRRNGL